MEAARKMAKQRIRRLVVVDRGVMLGILTSRDILSTAPGTPRGSDRGN